ncbi:MAG: hypothetical protein QM488_12585 [Rhizobiaceae bacterium]
MTAEEFNRLYLLALRGIDDVGWHWFSYHFHNGPTPFAMCILEACAAIDERTERIGTTLLSELISIGGRDRDAAQYEQLLQKMGEILVIERVVCSEWPRGTTFQHEPAAFPGGARPELVVNFEDGRLVVEVKTPSQLNHIRNRANNRVQLAYRGGVSRELAEKIAEDEGVVLPRDNPILDFLRDANRKFDGFRQEQSTSSLLVIVWDDHIYEPISTLVNEASGLLTVNSFAKNADGIAETYPNIDAVVVLRHLNYMIAGSREEPLLDRVSALDFGGERALPNVLFLAQGERQLPEIVLERLRAYFHDDPGLKMFAEYNPQDVVFWM